MKSFILLCQSNGWTIWFLKYGLEAMLKWKGKNTCNLSPQKKNTGPIKTTLLKVNKHPLQHTILKDMVHI